MTTANLAIHYFYTARMRQWIEQEIFLDPNFLVIKVFAAISNLAVDFIKCKYPSAAAFGAIPLPAAFVKGRAVGTSGIVDYLQTLTPQAEETFDEVSLRTLIECVMGEAIAFNLWGDEDCCSLFTWPIMKDSLSRPFADYYCRQQKAVWRNKDTDLLKTRLDNLLSVVGSKILTTSFLFGNEPKFVDVVAYSYLSVLLSIPEKYMCFKQEDSELVQRLKSYLLDFDDWLWQRASEGELVGTAEPHIATPEQSSDDSELPTDSPEPTPFLGKDYATRKSNVIFLVSAALSTLAIGYWQL